MCVSVHVEQGVVVQGECACMSVCVPDKEWMFRMSVHGCLYACMTRSGCSG